MCEANLLCSLSQGFQCPRLKSPSLIQNQVSDGEPRFRGQEVSVEAEGLILPRALLVY